MQLKPFPLSLALLEQYRVVSRRQRRPGMVGGHQMRRKGQSMEFYDYRPYIPGDDIRHVDWRASVRHGSEKDWLVRTFVAEEQLTLIISLDTRESMLLPEVMPKGMIAAWLAEAVAWISLRSADKIIFHRLFGTSPGSVEEFYGQGSAHGLRRSLKRIYEENKGGDSLNLQVLERYLKPAVVWLIISDFYFDMEPQGRQLAARIARAQDGMRWIILLDMDSWLYEKCLLGEGARKIDGPGLLAGERPLEINAPVIEQIETRMKDHKDSFFRQVRRGSNQIKPMNDANDSNDIISWKWPNQEHINAGLFFETQFGKDRILQRLFMKES